MNGALIVHPGHTWKAAFDLDLYCYFRPVCMFLVVVLLFVKVITDNPIYTDTRYNDKIRHNAIWLSRNHRLRGDI